MRGNLRALFGKRPTEKDPAKDTTSAVDFTCKGDGNRTACPAPATGSNLVDTGRARCAPVPVWWCGELPGRLADAGPGGHGEVLRGSRGDAAGVELGSSFVERITVNAGTVLVLPVASRCQCEGCGLSPPSADRPGTGRSRRSTPSRGEPGAWGRAAAVVRREGGCNAASCAAEWQCSGPGPAGVVVAGSGDAGQASPLGGG